jgi:16S rRNA (adenine1518-N6/adenine1519-N6)-dimethyltransferase
MINANELLFVVDENNNPLQAKPRNETHAKHLWHRCSHIWVINAKKQVLCQKRTMLKDVNPGKWEAHFGGHVRDGEDYLDNAVIESKEEIGLDRDKKEMIFFKIYKYTEDREFQGIYYTYWDGDSTSLRLEKEEVDEVKWVDSMELKKIFREKDKLWVHQGYEGDLLDSIK